MNYEVRRQLESPNISYYDVETFSCPDLASDITLDYVKNIDTYLALHMNIQKVYNAIIERMKRVGETEFAYYS